MIRILGYLGAWCAATAVGIAISWLGIHSVLFAAVPGPANLTTPVGQIETSPSPSTGPGGAQVPPAISSPAVPSPAASAAGATPGASPDPRPSAAGTSAAPTPRRTDGPPVRSGGKGGMVRSFSLRGGTVAVRFARDSVSLVSATPGSGFVVAVAQPDAQALQVTFHAPRHTSVLVATAAPDAGRNAVGKVVVTEAGS